MLEMKAIPKTIKKKSNAVPRAWASNRLAEQNKNGITIDNIKVGDMIVFASDPLRPELDTAGYVTWIEPDPIMTGLTQIRIFKFSLGKEIYGFLPYQGESWKLA